MKTLLTSLVALALVLPALAQDKKGDKGDDKGKDDKGKDAKVEPLPLPKEKPEEEVPAEDVGRPPVELILMPGEASANPYRKGVSYANGGVISVSQPNPTTLVITMSGLAACNADLVCQSAAGYHFNLSQDFLVRVNAKYVKSPRLWMESRVIGLLRTNHELYEHCLCKMGGMAETGSAEASVACGDAELVHIALPPRSICCSADLSVYNHDGPLCIPVHPGCYTLHQTWSIGTSHPPFFCRGASAEFAPEPQYYPDANAWWFQHFKPFNGTATRDFGYQVTIKVMSK
jgi:hypothetical protein